MTLQNTDLFLVNRGGTSHRYSYADLRNDISVSGVTEQVIPDGEAVAGQVNGYWRQMVLSGVLLLDKCQLP